VNHDGILVINKPARMTSHDVVAQLRRTYNMKKIGHTGTLDPMVEGVMVIAFGKATKLVQFMMEEDKRYRVAVRLGISTDTEDVSGTVIKREQLTQAMSDALVPQIGQTLASFIGTYVQVPPMYAAIKVRGKKLYEYARNGEHVEREARTLKIFAIDYDATTYEHDVITGTSVFVFDVHGSKGLYARTLCVDIGQKLGVCATMNALTRTASGNYTLADAKNLTDVLTTRPPLIPLKDIRLPYRKVYVEADVASKLRTGYKLPYYFVAQHVAADEIFAVYDKSDDELIGIYRQSAKYADKYESIRVM